MFHFQFCVMSVRKYFDASDNGSLQMTEGQISIWILFALTGLGFAFLFGGLVLNSLLYTWKNVTQIELMKGTFKFID